MAYRQNPWIPERGSLSTSRIIALADGVSLKKVNGTVLAKKGDSQDFSFNVLDAARTSTAKAMLHNLIALGQIKVEVTPINRPKPRKKEEPEQKKYVPRDWPPRKPEEHERVDPEKESKTSSQRVEKVRQQLEMARERTRLGVEDLPKEPEPAPSLSSKSDDDDDSSSSYLVFVSSDGDESSSSEQEVQTDLNDDENLQEAAAQILGDLRDKLLELKGVGDKMVETILELDDWTRRKVESIKFMKTVNVGPIMKILEEYRSKLENL